MQKLLGVLFMAGLCSCSLPHQGVSTHSSTPASLSQDFRRESNEAFLPREREMIVEAKRYLRRSSQRPKGASEDAYYRVRPMAGGYEVFIVYVKGYAGTRPLFEPCLHNAVLLREDGSVLKVLTGPECWPEPPSTGSGQHSSPPRSP